MTGVEVEDVAIPLAGDGGHRVLVRIFRTREEGATAGRVAAVVYLRGIGDRDSSDTIARRVASRLAVAVLVPEEDVDPHDPASLARADGIIRWVATHGDRRGLDGERVAVFGQGLGAVSARLLIAPNRSLHCPVVTSHATMRQGIAGIEPAIRSLRDALNQGKAQGISG